MKIDGAKLKELLKEQGFNQGTFAKEVGVDGSTISNYVNGKQQPTVQVFNSMCFTLGCKKEDIELKELTSSAASIIQDSATSEELKELRKEVNGLRLDLQNMAKMLVQINKVVNECKAQEELNADDVKAMFGKVADVNSCCNKIYGKLTHKY